MILVARKASCRVANAFSTRSKLIWPKNAFLAKSSRRQWVKRVVKLQLHVAVHVHVHQIVAMDGM